MCSKNFLFLFREGQSFGEDALLLGMPHQRTYSAMGACELLCIKKNGLRESLDGRSEMIECLAAGRAGQIMLENGQADTRVELDLSARIEQVLCVRFESENRTVVMCAIRVGEQKR